MRLLLGLQRAPTPGSATALCVLCGGSMTAHVLLAQPGGLTPARVAVFGAEEGGRAWGDGDERGQLGRLLDDSSGDSPGSPWPWGPSRYLVFQRLTTLASRALGYYCAHVI